MIRLYTYIAGLLALIGAALGLYAKGRKDARQKELLQAHEASIKTIQEIDNAKAASAAGGGDWHERLRRDTE